jgi:hypothetical protein
MNADTIKKEIEALERQRQETQRRHAQEVSGLGERLRKLRIAYESALRPDDKSIREDALKLLPCVYWRWEDCEFGAPSVDCKRPYGNSSVYRDIADILGIEADDGQFSDAECERMLAAHRCTMTLLEELTGIHADAVAALLTGEKAGPA